MTLKVESSHSDCVFVPGEANRATQGNRDFFSFLASPFQFGSRVFVLQPNQDQPVRACSVLIFIRAGESVLNVPFPRDQSARFVLLWAG